MANSYLAVTLKHHRIFMETKTKQPFGFILHDAAFYSALFFILGVAAASAFLDWQWKWTGIIFLSVCAYAALHYSGRRAIALLSIFVLAGGAYFFSYRAAQKSPDIKFGELSRVTAIVKSVDASANSQTVDAGFLRLNLMLYPRYEYGDKIEAVGKIEEPRQEVKNYLLKDGILGTMKFPKATLISKGDGSALIASLIKLKNSLEDSLLRLLPYEKQVFMSGLIFGAKSEFTPEFKQALSRSGTSHLVALSGYNISVIVDGFALIFASFFARRVTFILTILSLIFFVLMTGASASVVRAALMGALVLLASQTERRYHFRNAITIVAALMLVQNPNILFFDIGFQLSFAALLGIVYLRPILGQLLRFSNDAGIFDWRKNLLTTLAAQIAVLPLLLASFGSASVSGLISNILILGVVPITMFVGFLAGTVGLISYYAALPLAALANILLSYCIGVIWLMSGFGYVSGITIGGWFVIVYYTALIGFVIYFNKRFLNLIPNEAS